jgi:hypothetical protein
MTTANKNSPNAKMFRSKATYGEYELFLTQYAFTYRDYKSQTDSIQKKEAYKKLIALLDQLALNSNVCNPNTVLKNGGEVFRFTAYHYVTDSLESFYRYFKNPHWSKKDCLIIEQLTALLYTPIMKF